jgi:hypothetical protein
MRLHIAALGGRVDGANRPVTDYSGGSLERRGLQLLSGLRLRLLGLQPRPDLLLRLRLPGLPGAQIRLSPLRWSPRLRRRWWYPACASLQVFRRRLIKGARDPWSHCGFALCGFALRGFALCGFATSTSG